jgi:hypothetical protein
MGPWSEVSSDGQALKSGRTPRSAGVPALNAAKLVGAGFRLDRSEIHWTLPDSPYSRIGISLRALRTSLRLQGSSRKSG